MEHYLAQSLIVASVRRLQDASYIEKLLKLIRAGSVQSHSVKYLKDKLWRVYLEEIDVEYARIDEEVSLVREAVNFQLDHSAYLPFEVQLEYLISGNTLADIFRTTTETQLMLFQYLTETYQYIRSNSRIEYVIAYRELFSSVLKTYLGADYKAKIQVPVLQRKRITHVEYFDLRICTEWPLETKYRSLSESARIQSFLHLVREDEGRQRLALYYVREDNYYARTHSVYQQRRRDLGPEFKTYKEFIAGGANRCESREIAPAETFYTDACRKISRNQTYRYLKPAYIYPLPPGLDEITAYAEVPKPFAFTNFSKSFPAGFSLSLLRRYIVCSNAGSSRRRSIIQMQNPSLMQQIEQEEVTRRASMWAGRYNANNELDYLAVLIYIECYIKYYLYIKRGDTGAQQALLNAWGERVLKIASGRPVPKDYAPILTECGRFVRYLNLKTGRTISIHPAVIQAQQMISRQCIRLDECVILPKDAEILSFRERGTLLNSWCYFIEAVPEVDASLALFAQVQAFHAYCAAWTREAGDWMAGLWGLQ